MTDQAEQEQPSLDELVAFLKGEAPLDGVWFGGKRPSGMPPYWWRKYLQPAIAQAHKGYQQHGEGDADAATTDRILELITDDIAYLMFGHPHRKLEPNQKGTMLHGTVKLAQKLAVWHQADIDRAVEEARLSEIAAIITLPHERYGISKELVEYLNGRQGLVAPPHNPTQPEGIHKVGGDHCDNQG